MRKILFVLYCAAFLNSRFAFGATYNFYFNNAEQGDNSTAAPSVVVKDEKGAAVPVVVEPTPDRAVTPAVPANRAETLVAVEPTLSDRINARRFRFQVGAGMAETWPGLGDIIEHLFDSFSSSSSGHGSSGSSMTSSSDYFKPGFELSATFLPSKYVGFTGFYGFSYGGEIDFSPLHAFGDRFEWGLMLGMSSGNFGYNGTLGPHIGTRFSFNTGYPVGLTLTSRFAPLSNLGGNYMSVALGLTYSL